MIINGHEKLHDLEGGEPACAGATNPELWFPEYQKDRQKKQHALAVAVCSTCSVKQACLEYALEYNDLDGIWGGTDLSERISIQRMRRITTRSVISVIPNTRPMPKRRIDEWE